MTPGVPAPEQWRSFRRGQAGGAAMFVPLALLGSWVIAHGDEVVGVAMLIGFGLFGGLALLNARTGHRGVDRVRVGTRNGHVALEFPAHRTGTVPASARSRSWR